MTSWSCCRPAPRRPAYVLNSMNLSRSNTDRRLGRQQAQPRRRPGDAAGRHHAARHPNRHRGHAARPGGAAQRLPPPAPPQSVSFLAQKAQRLQRNACMLWRRPAGPCLTRGKFRQLVAGRRRRRLGGRPAAQGAARTNVFVFQHCFVASIPPPCTAACRRIRCIKQAQAELVCMYHYGKWTFCPVNASWV